MKSYQTNDQLFQKIVSASKKICDIVGSTYGAAGTSVIIHNKNQTPFLTKDGVSVIKQIVFDDPFENSIVQLIKQAADKTNTTSGDGTTLTTILSSAILQETYKYLISGWNSYKIQQGMLKAVNFILQEVAKNTTRIQKKEQIAQIATISANNDKLIGELICEAVDKVGKDGSIVIENSNSLTTTLHLMEGYRIPAGYISQAFVPEGQTFIKYKRPYFLITSAKIEYVDDMLNVLKHVAREKRPLVIIADYVEGQALASLIMNATRGTLEVSAINAPLYGESKKNILRDIALNTGATFISPETGINLQSVELKHLGQCDTVEINKIQTIIIGGKGDQKLIEQRIDLLKAELQQETDLSICENIQERLTRLSSAVGIIKVGGSSEVEIIEKKFRIEDALEAVKGSLELGVSPGGATTLYNISKRLKEIQYENEEEQLGIRIIEKSIQKPVNKLIENSGIIPEVILSQLDKEPEYTVYNVRECKFCNAFEEGIIDPTKVVLCALQNAYSVSSVLLTSKVAIVET